MSRLVLLIACACACGATPPSPTPVATTAPRPSEPVVPIDAAPPQLSCAEIAARLADTLPVTILRPDLAAFAAPSRAPTIAAACAAGWPAAIGACFAAGRAAADCLALLPAALRTAYDDRMEAWQWVWLGRLAIPPPSPVAPPASAAIFDATIPGLDERDDCSLHALGWRLAADNPHAIAIERLGVGAWYGRILTKACVETRWSTQVTSCLIAALDQPDRVVQACLKRLEPAQATDLRARLGKLAALIATGRKLMRAKPAMFADDAPSRCETFLPTMVTPETARALAAVPEPGRAKMIAESIEHMVPDCSNDGFPLADAIATMAPTDPLTAELMFFRLPTRGVALRTGTADCDDLADLVHRAQCPFMTPDAMEQLTAHVDSLAEETFNWTPTESAARCRIYADVLAAALAPVVCRQPAP